MKTKKFIEYSGRLYFAYFEHEKCDYGRIQDAQGGNIAYAPMCSFKFPTPNRKIINSIKTSDFMFRGVEIWNTI